tara:strand:- start:124 stop:264 length:141 start_codon:yes stop_codon:yes gene_type:complete
LPNAKLKKEKGIVIPLSQEDLKTKCSKNKRKEMLLMIHLQLNLLKE